ncbi:hypothetical protein OSTOST_11306 [Ostertagia ostertagi]
MNSSRIASGYAINPARDFGPRLFTLCAGYGWRVFSYRSYKWFWIPIICPMLGALLGAWMYEFFIGFHIPDDPDTTYIHKVTLSLSNHLCHKPMAQFRIANQPSRVLLFAI